MTTKPRSIVDLVALWRASAAAAQQAADRLDPHSAFDKPALAGHRARIAVYERVITELSELVTDAGDSCPACGALRPTLVEVDLPAMLQLPPEPDVGQVVEIVGGEFDGVRVAHLRDQQEGWQTVDDPDGIWHEWTVVLALATRGGTGTVRIVP